MTSKLDYRNSVLKTYSDVYTPAALAALEVLAPFNRDRRELMARRIARRLARQNGRRRIAFLDSQALIPRTHIRVQDARGGKQQAVGARQATQKQQGGKQSGTTKQTSKQKAGAR